MPSYARVLLDGRLTRLPERRRECATSPNVLSKARAVVCAINVGREPAYFDVFANCLRRITNRLQGLACTCRSRSQIFQEVSHCTRWTTIYTVCEKTQRIICLITEVEFLEHEAVWRTKRCARRGRDHGDGHTPISPASSLTLSFLTATLSYDSHGEGTATRASAVTSFCTFYLFILGERNWQCLNTRSH
jgi:hypothetical protein